MADSRRQREQDTWTRGHAARNGLAVGHIRGPSFMGTGLCGDYLTATDCALCSNCSAIVTFHSGCRLLLDKQQRSSVQLPKLHRFVPVHPTDKLIWPIISTARTTVLNKPTSQGCVTLVAVSSRKFCCRRAILANSICENPFE